MFVISVAVFFLSAICAASSSSGSISYGPDAIVDTNTSASYAEPALAVSPKDATRLVAGAIVFTATGIGIEAFRSDDGGYNWKNALLPTGKGSVLGDVQAAYNADGYAYVTALGDQPSATGQAKNGLYVFGSSDNGESFQRLGFFQTPDGHSYDHEQLAIDRTHGRYRGRIYMTILYGLELPPHQVNGLGMIWSSDGGRTFHVPVLVSRGWSFNSRPVVLSDGTVLFPLIHNANQGDTKAIVQIARSADGGRTFNTPQTIGDRVSYDSPSMMKRLTTGDFTFDGDSVPQFAARRAPGAKADTVFGIWSDVRGGRSRLLYTRSVDGGKTWSTAREIFSTDDATDAQYQPSIAVNGAGEVGVSWYNGSFARKGLSEMFAMSSDDGETFSTPAAISSVVAPLKSSAADNYTALAFASPKGMFVSFAASGSRFPSGGDYMDLSADASGAFHPVWIDARTGVTQVWNATVFPRAAAPDPPGLSKKDVTTKVGVEFGVASWDADSQTIAVPMRLHNLSEDTLYPPFTVTVNGTKNPYYPDSKTAVSVLNADNGEAGVGATYVFDAKTIGNLGRLLPGADTSSRTLKVKIDSDMAAQPVLITSVTANMQSK